MTSDALIAPSLQSRLYPEIHDMIIDHLHDNRSTLLSTALVSRSWLPTSRYHAFSSFAISPNNRPSIIRVLQSPLSTIATHVKELSIMNVAERLRDGYVWLNAELPKVAVEAMTSVDHLSISVLTWGKIRNAHGAILALLRMVSKLSLEVVTFDGLDTWFDFFACAPLLKQLSVSVVQLEKRYDSKLVYDNSAYRPTALARVGVIMVQTHRVFFLSMGSHFLHPH